MKRDVDLVRLILQRIEEPEDEGFVGERIHIDGYTEDQIGYHIYLMAQAGLIEAESDSVIGSVAPSALAKNLTWKGHEFLDASKDSKLWALAKAKVIGPAGTAAFSVLSDYLIAQAKIKLGLPP